MTGMKHKLATISRKAVDTESRRISVTLSTASPDRDGDVIHQAGWDLDNYRRNPVVLAFHDPKCPIARGENIRLEGGALVGDMQFPAEGKCRMSDDIFNMYEAGVLSAVSVGFMPREMTPRAGDDGVRTGGYDITRAELWEFSAVAIPSNTDALVRAKGTVSNLLLARAIKSAIGKAPAGTQMTTGEAEGHVHTFAIGETETDAAGDPEHVHALAYDADGSIEIGPAEDGHTHGLPDDAMLDPPEEDAEETEERDAPSGFFPESERSALREDWPELLDEHCPSELEAKIAKVVRDHVGGRDDFAAVRLLLRYGAIGRCGIERMREVIHQMKDAALEARETNSPDQGAELDTQLIKRVAVATVNTLRQRGII